MKMLTGTPYRCDQCSKSCLKEDMRHKFAFDGVEPIKLFCSPKCLEKFIRDKYMEELPLNWDLPEDCGCNSPKSYYPPGIEHDAYDEFIENGGIPF